MKATLASSNREDDVKLVIGLLKIPPHLNASQHYPVKRKCRKSIVNLKQKSCLAVSFNLIYCN